MIASSTKDLVKEVSLRLNLPEKVVTSVVKHQFNDIRSFLDFPSHATYQIEELGTLKPNLPYLTRMLSLYFSWSRKDPQYLNDTAYF